MSHHIRFILNGQLFSLQGIPPTLTLLRWLREYQAMTGTKEGCGEGDCGACTVVLAEAQGKRLVFYPINACLRFLPTLDGKAIFTVEGLKALGNGQPHPAQQAMIDTHGSQCGFCTPGFVMSLFALFKNQAAPTRTDVENALTGNLCRCTGYRPIVDAAARMYDLPGQGWLATPAGATVHKDETVFAKRLKAIAPQQMLSIEHDAGRYFAPLTLAELDNCLAQYPAAQILAGGTDIGLWVTKQHRELPVLIYIGQINELQQIQHDNDWLTIGAGASLEQAWRALVSHYPTLRELHLRFASLPIRHSGTLGGNIANGSPIGDAMPALIALGATIVLHRGGKKREMPLEDYYLAYQQTARQPGEVLSAIKVPLQPDLQLAVYKVSKRFDQDISAVCAAFALRLNQDNTISHIRVAYGGMAAIPTRVTACEQALRDQPWTQASIEQAQAVLGQSLTPLSDMRASAAYRMQAAANMLQRFYLESTQPDLATRVIDYGGKP